MTQPTRETMTVSAATMDDAVAQALENIFGGAATGTGDEFVLVFSGSGPDAADAFRAALDDLREQCLDNHGRPVSLASVSTMEQDSAFRIWGSVNCTPHTGASSALPLIGPVTLQEEEDDQWTLTITLV